MRTLIFLLLLSLAATATAQEAEPIEETDYSRDTLLRLFADNPIREETEPRVRLSVGAIDFRVRGARFRIGYLPFFMPLQGSMPWLHSHRWPDPFTLTGTELPYTARTWRDERALSAEVRRIERRLRESGGSRGTSATVQVKPD